MELHIDNLPFELLENILRKTDGITATRCRLVSKNWKVFVDTNETLWREICQKEFRHASKIAKQKCREELSWKNIYRNLKMWPKIAGCSKVTRKFYNFTTHDKNHALDIDYGILVLKESKGMLLYDMSTLKYLHVAIPKNCLKIANNDIATVILVKNTIFIQRNINNGLESEATFQADKFVLTDTSVFYYNNRDIYKCDLKQKELLNKLLLHCDYDIAEIEHNNGSVHLFTDCGHIVTIRNENDLSVKSVGCPEEWVRSIKHIRALDNKNYICYSRNLFLIETDEYKHVSLDFPPITSLFFYGDNVLIGTKSGEILLYRLSKQKRSTKPIFEKIVKMPEETYAVSLDVYERKKGPIIVASTFFDIILIDIEFFSVEEENTKLKSSAKTFPNKITAYKRLLRLKERFRPR